MYQNNVKNFFEQISSKYYKNFLNKKSSKNYTFAIRKKIILDNIINKCGNFIDIATGSGEISSKLLKKNKFKKIFLVDISKKMLNKTKKKINNCENVFFINKDFAKLKTKIKFDYILCIGILAHYPNTDFLISKLSKLSNKKGKVIIQSSLLNFFTIKMNKFFFSNRFQKKNKYKLNYINEKNLLKLFSNYNFKILKKYKFSLSLPFLDNFIPKFNYYLDLYFDKYFSNLGAEAIYILEKK